MAAPAAVVRIPSNTQRIKILAVLDTIHDFYKERGVASDDEEDIDVTKMLFIRVFIARVIYNYITTDAELNVAPFTAYAVADLPAGIPGAAGLTDQDILNQLNSLVTRLTLGKIRSISSNFEPNVVKCFEEWYPFELSAKTKREDTYDDIVGMDDDTEAEKDAAKIAKIAEYNGIRGLSDILILTSRDDSSFGALTDTDKNRLADFILHYFFGAAAQAPRFTFDGKAGIVSKVFKGIEQSRNIIFPQTIADSAPTSFNSFHGRNEFRFPVGGPEAGVDPVAPLGAGEVAYPQKYAKSNIYTRGKCSISYVNTRGFDAKHQFGFSLRITYGGQKVDIDFSATQTEGPSVNYLISLLQEADVAGGDLKDAVSSKKTTLRIGDTLEGKTFGTAITGLYSDIVPTPGAAVGVLRLILKAILLDIKRTGDNEQAEAILTEALGIFCSIDHLSILYARLKKKNCIFHVGEKMILFRFLTVAVDPLIQAANAAIWKARQSVDLLAKIDAYIGGDDVRAPISVAFRDQALHIQRAARGGTGPFFNIVTMLLRLKMIDILQKLRTSGAIQNNPLIQEGNHLAEPGVITDAQRDIIATIAQRVPDNVVQRVTNDNIRRVNQASGIITNVFDNFFLTLNHFNITTTNVTNINKDIIQIPGTNFISKKNHELFNYNAEPFYKLDKNIESILAIGARVRGQRYREKTGIISILQRMGYFTNVENIVNQFYDDRIRELIKQILDVNTRCDNIIIADNKLLEEQHKLYSVLELFNQNNIPLAAGEPNTRGDGMYHFPIHNNVHRIPGMPVPSNILTEINLVYTPEYNREFPLPQPQPLAVGPQAVGMQEGGAIQLYKQKGGAYTEQYSDFDELIRNICAMATNYIESVYQEAIPTRFAELQRFIYVARQIVATVTPRLRAAEQEENGLNAQLTAVSREKEINERNITLIQGEIGEIGQLQAEIGQLQAELAQIQDQLRFVHSITPQQQYYIQQKQSTLQQKQHELEQRQNNRPIIEGNLRIANFAYIRAKNIRQNLQRERTAAQHTLDQANPEHTALGNVLLTIPGLNTPPAGITPLYVIKDILHSPLYINSTRSMCESIIAEYEIRLQEIRQTPDYTPSSGELILSYVLSFINKPDNEDGVIRPISNNTTFLNVMKPEALLGEPEGGHANEEEVLDYDQGEYHYNIKRRDLKFLKKILKRFDGKSQPPAHPHNPLYPVTPSLPNGVDGFPILEGFQLMILHFLHLSFSPPPPPPAFPPVPPIPEAASLFRSNIVPRLRVGDYATAAQCNTYIMANMQQIINLLAFGPGPRPGFAGWPGGDPGDRPGGNFVVGGARKPRRNRTRKFHVKRRRTIKRRRS